MKKNSIFFLWGFFQVALAAADPAVTAKVSATEMNLNSSITLLVEVSGVNNVGGAPQLNIPDFLTQPAGQTSSFQWVNGQTTSLITFNYVLTPNKTGNLQIPSLTLNVGGKTVSTQPILITVHPDSNNGQAAVGSVDSTSKPVQVPAEGLKPMFMTASVDSEKVYVGQQILLKVQFLRRPEVRLASQARYSEPDMTGFLLEPLQQQEYTTTINGARYQVTELPYALFPTSDGDFAIGSANVDIAVQQQADPFDSNSFFQSFFGRSEVIHLNTRAIPIRVRALPTNKPANFSGAVGRFKISAKIDSDHPEVGKPFNLIVSVEGVGNIKTLKEPFLTEPQGFRRYETISSSKLSKVGKFLSGSKEFKILMIPQVSGQLTIPPVSFTYFNPAKSEYETTATSEMNLQVKPGALTQADQDSAPNTPISAGQVPEGVRVMEKDIRFLKNGRVHPIAKPLFMRGSFIFFNFLPPLFALVAFITKRQSTLRAENASHYRSKTALKSARKSLSKARKLIAAQDPTSFYGAIYNAVAGYLADKLSLAASGLLWEDVDRRLSEKNITGDLRTGVREIFDQADMARFATSSFSDEPRANVLAQADNLLKQLDEVL